MKEEGPMLQALIASLAECPTDFLETLMIGKEGKVFVPAVVSDLIRDLGGSLLSFREANIFSDKAKDTDKVFLTNHLKLILVASWVFHDAWFLQQKRFSAQVYHFLANGLQELASIVKAEKFVSEQERREELVRLCLETLDLRPAGETVAQAQDRLTALDSVESHRVILETRKNQERNQAILEALRKKAQAEAATKITRE